MHGARQRRCGVEVFVVMERWGLIREQAMVDWFACMCGAIPPPIPPRNPRRHHVNASCRAAALRMSGAILERIV